MTVIFLETYTQGISTTGWRKSSVLQTVLRPIYKHSCCCIISISAYNKLRSRFVLFDEEIAHGRFIWPSKAATNSGCKVARICSRELGDRVFRGKFRTWSSESGLHCISCEICSSRSVLASGDMEFAPISIPSNSRNLSPEGLNPD